MSRPVVYLAGPYTHPDPVTTTRRALGVGASLMDDRRCWPLVPHQSLVFDLLHPRPVGDWYALDLALLERCDAVYRLLGESTGADREVQHARRLGLPVFFEASAHWLPAPFEEWLDSPDHAPHPQEAL